MAPKSGVMKFLKETLTNKRDLKIDVDSSPPMP